MSANNNATNGKVFEYLIALVLAKEHLRPFYFQAQVTFVPNAIYDFLFYTSTGRPVVLSAKVSLRERYKQADLEAMALKNVHRRAEAWLITLSEAEAASLKPKIEKGEAYGLDGVILADHPEFTDLLDRWRKENFVEAPSVPVVQGTIGKPI